MGNDVVFSSPPPEPLSPEEPAKLPLRAADNESTKAFLLPGQDTSGSDLGNVPKDDIGLPEMPMEGPQETDDGDPFPGEIASVTSIEPPLDMKPNLISPFFVDDLIREVDKLKEELMTTQKTNLNLQKELDSAKEEILVKNRRLESAVGSAADFQIATKRLSTAAEEILRLRRELEQEKLEKCRIQEQFQKFRDSFTCLSLEFLELQEELRKHFLECCKNPNRLDDPAFFQNRLDNLTYFAQDKFQAWATEQMFMQEGLANAKDKIIYLEKSLKSESKKPPHQDDQDENDSMEVSAEPSAKKARSTEKKLASSSSCFVCGECGNEYLNQSILQRHQKTAHAKPAFGSSFSSKKTDEKVTSNATPGKPNKMAAVTISSSTSSDSDDDIVIIKTDIKSPPTNPSYAAPVLKIMSSLALSFAKPASEANGSAVVPIKVVQKKKPGPVSRKGNKSHGRDISKRQRGFYCICGIKFISRKRLDGHLNFHKATKNYNEEAPPVKRDEVTAKSKPVAVSGKLRKLKDEKKASSYAEESHSPPASPEPIPILIPKPIRHKLDTSKSRRGCFCTCGGKFKNMGRLNNHIIRLRLAAKNNVKLKEDEVDDSKFTCMTCGQSFDTNVQRIEHRMQAHGHGLSTK